MAQLIAEDRVDVSDSSIIERHLYLNSGCARVAADLNDLDADGRYVLLLLKLPWRTWDS